MKCKRCGKSLFGRGGQKISDGYICYPCFYELCIEKSDRSITSPLPYRFDEIKDGKEAYINRLIDERAAEYDKSVASLVFAHYGEERDINETDEESEIFDLIRSMVSDPEQLDLVRVSDDYLTIKVGEWDLVRIKYTERAKWIIFPIVEAKAKKHYIEDPEDVLSFSDLLADSIAHIDKYSNR